MRKPKILFCCVRLNYGSCSEIFYDVIRGKECFCEDVTPQAGEIIFSWSVDDVSLTVSRECVLDHIFDTVGVYNVCVTAFNSGELLCLLRLRLSLRCFFYY